MLDGQCWQARSDGSVVEAPRSAEAPFGRLPSSADVKANWIKSLAGKI